MLVLVLVLVLGPTASITSTSTISLSTSTTEPAHRRVGRRSILRCGDHILALIAEDLERFIEDRSQLGEEHRAATIAKDLLMLHLRIWDAHPVDFPIDLRFIR